MRLLTKLLLQLLVILVISASIKDQPVKETESDASAIWRKIASFFKVPAEFEGKYWEDPSLLKFYDRQPVRTKKDWNKRREEYLLIPLKHTFAMNRLLGFD
jgi:hypothetical protein